MRNIIVLIFVFSYFITSSQKNPSFKSLVKHLSNQQLLSPKEYVLTSFQSKDIIIFSERHHGELKQYQLVVDILKDKRFKGNIYTEVGTSSMTKAINQFLVKVGLSEKEKKAELLKIYRNLDYEILWDNYNYYFLIDAIYEINQHRKRANKIRLFPLDVGFQWSAISSTEQLEMFYQFMQKNLINRNLVMGKNFVAAYEKATKTNSERKKALVILNTYHGYTKIPKYLPLPNKPDIYSAAEYIYKTYPNRTINILINGYIYHPKASLVADGKWDAAFHVAGNKNVGFQLSETPFGETQFDMYRFGKGYNNNIAFQDIFDGLIFYEPIESFRIAKGIPDAFVNNKELYYYRAAIEYGISIEEAKKSNKIKERLIRMSTLTIKKVKSLDILKKQMNRWIN